MFKRKEKYAKFIQEVEEGFGYTSPNKFLQLGNVYLVEADFAFGNLRIIQVKGCSKFFPAKAFEIFES